VNRSIAAVVVVAAGVGWRGTAHKANALQDIAIISYALTLRVSITRACAIVYPCSLAFL
jgi:hypothetical protein